MFIGTARGLRVPDAFLLFTFMAPEETVASGPQNTAAQLDPDTQVVMHEVGSGQNTMGTIGNQARSLSLRLFSGECGKESRGRRLACQRPVRSAMTVAGAVSRSPRWVEAWEKRVCQRFRATLTVCNCVSSSS